MSNEIAVTATAPSYLANLGATFEGINFDQVNLDAMQGLGGGSIPTIALNGTRFVVKEGGEDTTLNQVSLPAVILSARKNFTKAWYATKFTPGAEPTTPDCYSNNGLTPAEDAKIKQHNQCAGCPQNEFGSGTDAQGNPSKGKACTDKKVLAIFANHNVYKFAIPPASLTAFNAYVKTMTSRGIRIPTAITEIGFDPKFTFPVLTFNFMGYVPDSAISTVVEHMQSQLVKDIIDDQIVMPALPVSTPAPVSAAPIAPKKVAKKVEPIKVDLVEPEVIIKPTQATKAPSDEELAAALGISL